MVGIIKGFNDISQMQAEEEACCRNPDRDEYNPDELKERITGCHGCILLSLRCVMEGR